MGKERNPFLAEFLLEFDPADIGVAFEVGLALPDSGRIPEAASQFTAFKQDVLTFKDSRSAPAVWVSRTVSGETG